MTSYPDNHAQQLEILLAQGDKQGAHELLKQAIEKPLLEEDAGAQYVQLFRIYLRYMAQLNEQYANSLKEGEQLLRDIDYQEKRVYKAMQNHA